MPISSNYLTPVDNQSQVVLRDFQHAARLYVDDTYARAPKHGFIYFVQFEIDKNVILDSKWGEIFRKDVGLLVKKVDLPKFNITTEKINQYNRKTVIQSKLNYNDVTIEFHDDNSDITNSLWINYYQHYYVDSRVPNSFGDTKFGVQDYTYGRYSRGVEIPFFNKINIFVLHQQKFTQFSLINPKVTEWQHDNLDQSNGSKILQNRMTVAYESVVYDSGVIKGSPAAEFSSESAPYDKGKSPYQYGDLTGPTPIRNFGPTAPYVQGGPGNPPGQAEAIGKILLQNYLNKKGLGRQGAIGYNIAGGLLGVTTQSGAGKYSSPQPNRNEPGVFGTPGGVGINIFKGFNTSVDGKVRANPAAILFPKR